MKSLFTIEENFQLCHGRNGRQRLTTSHATVACLFRVCVGMFDCVDDACRRLVKETGSAINPCVGRVEIYRRLHSVHRPLYGAPRDFYERDAELVSYASG